MTGRRWAYLGAFLGGLVSVAANVAHSYVPPGAAPLGWRPHAGSVVGAAFWPVALLVAVEILARVEWPDSRRWLALRWAGLLPVAVVAAVVSYRHLSALLAYYGDDPLTAALGPLAVDGLMVMATGALIATSRPAAALVAAVEPEPAAQPPAPREEPAERRRPPAPRSGDEPLLRLIREVLAAEPAAGVPRVVKEARAKGLACGKDRAGRLLAMAREAAA
jgi:hypothetical protein